MRYVIEQRLTLAKPRFSITDEAGNIAFEVEGKALRIFEQLWLRDPSGTDVAFIKQRKTFRPSYEVFRGGNVAAIVSAKQRWFRLRFHVTDALSGAEIIASGNFSGYEYSFDRGGDTVAHVTKKLRLLRDTYVLDVSDREDHVLFVCAVLVIDAVSDQRQRQQDNMMNH